MDEKRRLLNHSAYYQYEAEPPKVRPRYRILSAIAVSLLWSVVILGLRTALCHELWWRPKNHSRPTKTHDVGVDNMARNHFPFPCSHRLTILCFKWAPGYNPFDGDFNVDPNWPCETVTFEEGAKTASLSFQLSPEAQKIHLRSRGHIMGDVTFESGGTAGDNIEVEMEFEKPEWYPEGEDYDDYPDREGSRKVRVCPFFTPNGTIHSLDIFVSVCEHHTVVRSLRFAQAPLGPGHIKHRESGSSLDLRSFFKR